MLYNLSTILYNKMKKKTNNTDFQPYFLFEPKKINTNIKTTNLTLDIEFENKKSLELYKKFNTNPKFRILDTSNQKININQIIKTTNNKKHGFCIISCFCIFLASFPYFPYFNYLSFSFRSV